MEENDGPTCFNPQASTIIGGQYAIVKALLSQLSMTDLENCAKVCRLWQDIANICIREQKRYQPTSFYWEGECSNYYSPVLNNYANHADPRFFQSSQHAKLSTALAEYEKSLLIRPKLVVAFASGETVLRAPLDDETGEPLEYNENGEHPAQLQLHSWIYNTTELETLFPDSSAMGITTRGVIGTRQVAKEELTSLEQENLYEDSEDPSTTLKPCLSLLCIPDKPGVKVLPFYLKEESLLDRLQEIKQDFPYLEDDTVIRRHLLQRSVEGLQDTDKVKAAVFLSNGLDLPYSMDIIRAVGERQNNSLAIGGGVGDLSWSTAGGGDPLSTILHKLVAFGNSDNPGDPVPDNFYMATSGFLVAGEAVEAASLILNRKVRSEKEVRKRLESLKGRICEDNSLAFMFACCGRGEEHYRGKRNLESQVFRSLFPRTPLAGIFGNGEIGMEWYPGSELKYKGELKASQVLHSFTTIFLLISLGR